MYDCSYAHVDIYSNFFSIETNINFIECFSNLFPLRSFSVFFLPENLRWIVTDFLMQKKKYSDKYIKRNNEQKTNEKKQAT